MFERLFERLIEKCSSTRDLTLYLSLHLSFCLSVSFFLTFTFSLFLFLSLSLSRRRTLVADVRRKKGVYAHLLHTRAQRVMLRFKTPQYVTGSAVVRCTMPLYESSMHWFYLTCQRGMTRLYSGVELSVFLSLTFASFIKHMYIRKYILLHVHINDI